MGPRFREDDAAEQAERSAARTFAPITGDPYKRLFQRQKWTPAFERVKKLPAPAQNPVVMARLDRAIHEKANEFNVTLDGRVKPGHDNRGRRQFFTHSFAGMTAVIARSSSIWAKLNSRI